MESKIKISYSTKAEKQFLKLPSSEQKKILKKTTVFKSNPLVGKKLVGEFTGLYSFKAWPYRIIYTFSHKNQTIYIVTIQHRQGVYK